MNLRLAFPLLFTAATLSLAAQEAPAPAGQPVHFEKQVTLTYRYDYLLYLPQGYDQAADQKWPLVIFLHGSGESGNDLEKLKKEGLPKVLETRHDLRFVCIAPQAPARGWDLPALNAMLDDALVRYRVDEDRVILTGLSMGGFGTWDWAGSNPGRFAAAVPICGAGSPIRATALRNVPVWAFHGAEDPRVPIEWQEFLVKLLEKRGGTVKWTVYPGVGHESWRKAYDEPELYSWMLAQKRHPAPSPAPAK